MGRPETSPPEREPRPQDRVRRFAILFNRVPAWRRREIDRVLVEINDDEHDRLVRALEREARALAIRRGIRMPGMRERFTVACLWFFDHPIELRDSWPQLYRQMEITLGADPARNVTIAARTQAA
jgi:Mlc titration factor MtfA (ptsG expression regulator)